MFGELIHGWADFSGCVVFRKKKKLWNRSTALIGNRETLIL